MIDACMCLFLLNYRDLDLKHGNNKMQVKNRSRKYKTKDARDMLWHNCEMNFEKNIMLRNTVASN